MCAERHEGWTKPAYVSTTEFVADDLSVDSRAGQDCATASAAIPQYNVSNPCPIFSGELTKDELQPFVLDALSQIKPRSCSALDLTQKLWPNGSRAIRHAMKTMVSTSLRMLRSSGVPQLCTMSHTCSHFILVVYFVSVISLVLAYNTSTHLIICILRTLKLV